MKASAPAQRRAVAAESFKTAAEAIGPITPGLSLFALTRGQWSMIDAILHVLDCVGPSAVSTWTWTVAEYEVEVLTRLRRDERITAGRLVIDYGARNKNAGIIREWKDTFGPESVRYCVNHAKIAMVESASGFRCLLRGSMNLNFNPRFEQFDLTEGGPDFDLVRSIEDELPVLPDSVTGEQAYAASKVHSAFSQETLNLFGKVKTWAK
jgi:hypothetical protein